MPIIKKIISLTLVILLAVIFLKLFSSPASADVTLPDPLNLKGKDLTEVILRILQVSLGFVGIVALLMFIIGGFEFLMSGGNQNLIKKGKDTLVWASIGIVVILLSYSILKFIFERLVNVSK